MGHCVGARDPPSLNIPTGMTTGCRAMRSVRDCSAGLEFKTSNSCYRPRGQIRRTGMLRINCQDDTSPALLSDLSRSVGSGTAPIVCRIGADASARVAAARFALQLTFGLMPKLSLVAFSAAVLLPQLVGTLSHPVLCIVCRLFHIVVPPSFCFRMI